MNRYTVPAEFGINRGAAYQLVFRSADGETPFEDGAWALDLGHKVGDPDVISTTADTTERAGDPPLIRFTLDEDETAEIVHNLLVGDVEVNGVPQARFIIPVSGDFTENP